MIPDRVVEVITGPTYLQIGTRDENLRPSHTVAVGAIVHEDRRTVTVLVPTARAARILPHLEVNGRVALGVSQASHESYQLKGTFLGTRPTNPGDVARQDAYRKTLLADARRVGFPDEIAWPLTQGFVHTPTIAITFRTDEVFLQTPGPDAGTKLA